VALTEIVGGAISGYCVIGSETKPMIPRITMKIEITVDRTGRLITLLNFIVYSFLTLYIRMLF
jgi:hypothetical protein